MDYKEQIEKLKNLECIAYGYNINGEVLGMDCGDFEQIMVGAAESIKDLLARVEAAEKRLQEVKEQRDYCREQYDVAEKNYQIEMERRKSAEYRARKTEQERDAAVSDLETIIDRLAAYEETGLEPEEITRVFNEDSVLKLTSQILQITPDRLRELAKADRDGRCMVLPCNVDDDVYINILGKTLEFLVISVSKIQSTPTFRALHGVNLCYIFKEEDIGETVFLTRIDAESALAEKGNN